jgi:LCP family protein required for cell wall assembly
VSVGVAVLVVLLAGAAAGYYVHFNNQITRVQGVIDSPPPTGAPITRQDGSTAPPPAPATNVLLVGADTRNARTKHLPHTGGQACNCADTLIFAHIPEGHEKAILVSIPRDSWVEIPAYTAPSGHTVPEHRAKVNSALAEGGPALLVDTVQQITGLHVDHYVQINFNGFVDMVNAVDGVDVCLTHDAHDKDSGVDLSKGVHHLDGVEALEYVRQRHGLPNGDLDRIKRQQAVIQQVAGKIVTKGILLHPVRLTDFLDSVTSNVTVDDQLGTGEMISLAQTFSHFDSAHMEFATVPVATDAGWRDGQSVVLLDDQGVDTMFNDVAQGYLPGDRSASPSPGGSATSPSGTPSAAPTTAHSPSSGIAAPPGVRCLP